MTAYKPGDLVCHIGITYEVAEGLITDAFLPVWRPHGAGEDLAPTRHCTPKPIEVGDRVRHVEYFDSARVVKLDEDSPVAEVAQDNGWLTYCALANLRAIAPAKPAPTLAEVHAAASRAAERVSTWPEWKRSLSEQSPGLSVATAVASMVPCPDCNATGLYVGLYTQEACRTCGGRKCV